jgi:hypothetical protein
MFIYNNGISGGPSMNKKNIKTEAAVLLLAALMVFSSVTVLANTNISSTPAKPTEPTRDGLVWDNNILYHGALGGIIVAIYHPDGTGTGMPADDFQFTTVTQVNGVFWQGGYFQTESAQGNKDYGWPWHVIFWNDDGTGEHPADPPIYNETFQNASIPHTFWYNYTRTDVTPPRQYYVFNYTLMDIPTITFDANKKYWISIIGEGVPFPQSCWVRHNETFGGIRLHESMIRAPAWGYADWTAMHVLAPDLLNHDLNFQLFGGAPGDTTAPVTTATFLGTNPVTVTITATDDMSGVNHTYYNLDAAGYVEYAAPFDVTVPGNHTIFVYSTDKAGNSETPHSYPFTVAPPPIGITIKKGLGITATIKNTGTTTLTNISWKIELTGGLIILGKSKPGTIATLAPAATFKAKDFVLGFGKTNIVVTAGSASATASGTVLLILVI